MVNDDPVLIDRTWHFPAGATLPLVSGGSDAGTTTVPDPGADPAAPAQGDPAPVSEPDESVWPQAARDHIAKLRNEAKGYREKLTPYEERYKGVPDDDRAAIDEFLGHYKAGDQAKMLAWLLGNAKGLAGDQWTPEFAGFGGPPPATPKEGDDAPFDPLDPKSVQEYLDRTVDERIKGYDSERTQRETVSRLAAEVGDLLSKAGYSVDDPAGQHILFMARKDGDVEKAIADYEAMLDERANAYATKKAEQAKAAAGTTPAGQPPASGKPADKSDPEARMKARLDQAFSRPSAP